MLERHERKSRGEYAVEGPLKGMALKDRYLLFGKHLSLTTGGDCHLIWKCNRSQTLGPGHSLETLQANITFKPFLVVPYHLSALGMLLMLAPMPSVLIQALCTEPV